MGSSERAVTGLEVPVGAAPSAGAGAGQPVCVALVKGEKGLGFTITTRDNPTGGHCPIYIKNILPKVRLFMYIILRCYIEESSCNHFSVKGNLLKTEAEHFSFTKL